MRRPRPSSAASASPSARARSAGTSTRRSPAKCPARWAIRLSSQLPPWRATTSATVSTRPGRSGPMSVRTRLVIAAASIASGRGFGREQAAHPEIGELLLDAVLPQALGQVAPVDGVLGLVLVEAGEHDRLAPGDGIDLLLQALRADLLHHALHGRVDRGDGGVPLAQVGAQLGVAGPGDRR